jgi:3-oxoadipate enol-lactonase
MVNPTQSGDAKTRDGIAIHYALYGTDAPAKPRLVLIHSLGMSGVVWQHVLELLGDRVTALAIDCRGHGSSTKAPAPFHLASFANDLADVMDQVGWKSAHVAGGSLGGSVALQFAIANPGRVQTLGLIDTTAWYGADAPQKWDWRAKEAEEKGLPALIEFQKTRWFSDAFREKHPELVERYAQVFLANTVACFAATCRMLGAFDLRAGLAGLHMPVAIIVGEEDYATPPEMARALEQGIAGSTLQIIPKARHLTFIERSDVISEYLLRLIARAPA